MQGAFFGTKFFKALESLFFLQRFNNEMLQMCARKINMRFLNDFFVCYKNAKTLSFHECGLLGLVEQYWDFC